MNALALSDRTGACTYTPSELKYVTLEAAIVDPNAPSHKVAPSPCDTSPVDADVVEILGILLEGRRASIRRMGVTPRTFTSYVEEWGTPSKVYVRFPFPVYQWLRPGNQVDVRIILIDSGAVRIRVETCL
jgi:hypothetical protein